LENKNTCFTGFGSEIVFVSTCLKSIGKSYYQTFSFYLKMGLDMIEDPSNQNPISPRTYPRFDWKIRETNIQMASTKPTQINIVQTKKNLKDLVQKEKTYVYVNSRMERVLFPFGSVSKEHKDRFLHTKTEKETTHFRQKNKKKLGTIFPKIFLGKSKKLFLPALGRNVSFFGV
jgi:hypothetical protein